MEHSKKRIQRIGRILRIICRIMKTVFLLATIVMFCAMILYIVSSSLGYQPTLNLDETIFSGSIESMTENGIIDTATATIISSVLTIITLVILFCFANELQTFMSYIEKGDQPFTFESAYKLRKLSYGTLTFLVMNLFWGIIVFFITQLLSYLFEYGAYLQQRADETYRIQEEMILSFAEITENKSEQTGRHVRRVAEYTRIIALAMGYPEDEAKKLMMASTMHDIGKLLIPVEILEKPAKLTDEEFAVIKQHSGYGGQLLNNVEGEVMNLARTVALDHHERLDGKGYPAGKSGETISIDGRIVAVADVYDALTSKRSYKEAWDEKKAYNEILKGKGTQFDSSVVDAFCRSYEQINDIRQTYADA